MTHDGERIVDRLDRIVDRFDRIVDRFDRVAGGVEAELKRVSAAPTGGDRSRPVAEPVAHLPHGPCAVSGRGALDNVVEHPSRGPARAGTTGAVGSPPRADVAPLIDHTLLRPEATRDEIAQVCEEAKTYGFAGVCVNSGHVPFVVARLDGSRVKPIAVVGFPLGAVSSRAKAFEAREAVRCGAREIDMVLNLGALKARDLAGVLEDIRCVVDASMPAPLKVILETVKLDDDEKIMACALAKAAGAAFVKTSTGFAGGGATPEDVAMMRAAVGPDMGVKASGGVRTIDDAEKMIAAGATRIGASASVAIVLGRRTGRARDSED